jgi:hypothetical protein
MSQIPRDYIPPEVPCKCGRGLREVCLFRPASTVFEPRLLDSCEKCADEMGIGLIEFLSAVSRKLLFL